MAAVSAMARHVRILLRQQLLPQALLSVEEITEVLPCPGPEARAWLVQTVAPAGVWVGVPVYRWGDVLAALEQRTANRGETISWLTTAQVAEHLGIPRSTLDDMIARAPRTLPGSPMRVGDGRKRQHLRWDAATMPQWLEAFRAWEAGRASRKEPAKPPAPRRRSRKMAPGAFDEAVDWKAVVKGYNGRG